ncbi:MAG: flagellar motor switch phosphatase FliY [Bacillota bacterium]
MVDNKMLSQEEIDAVLRASLEGEPAEAPVEAETSFAEEATSATDFIQEDPEKDVTEVLDQSEIDALGEIGNISMGSASTTLSELLHQKVLITSPKVKVVSQESLYQSFEVPYIIIQVEFKSGLVGYNILVIKLRDAMIMANLMMGGEGQVETEEITEIEISAASEAMNQMIGTASTSLATMFGRPVNISPPITTVLNSEDRSKFMLPIGESVVVVSFQMKIGDLVDTEIMQVLSIGTAKREAALLWHNLMGTPLEGEMAEDEPSFVEVEPEVTEEPWPSEELWPAEEPVVRETVETSWQEPAATVPTGGGYAPPAKPSQPQALGFSFPGLSEIEQRKLELLLDVPLKVSVILGRTKKPIKEVLNLTPGAIVELSSLVDEPVEVLVNGTLVARGEVVVVNENFGVRIINIISPEERLKQLRE